MEKEANGFGKLGWLTVTSFERYDTDGRYDQFNCVNGRDSFCPFISVTLVRRENLYAVPSPVVL